MSDKGDAGKGGVQANKPIKLQIVVNTTETSVEAKPDELLSVVAEKALKKTQNLGRPLTDWVLRKEDGAVLQMERTVGSYGLKDGDLLSLTLEAGAAG